MARSDHSIPDSVSVSGIPRPLAYRRTCWGKDPFARCSYSALQKGARPKHRKRLRKSLGKKVFFAGEHVDRDFCSMVHGALISGRKAARKVLKTKATRIGIIGAGMAGLAAARTLLDAGRHVQVIEARDRIGGRTWTDDSLGVPLDLGASWIHGPKGNPLTDLARAQGVEMVATKYEDTTTRGPDGDLLPDFPPSWAWEAFEVDQNYGMTRARLSKKAFDEGEDLPGTDVVFPQGYRSLFPALSKGCDIRLNTPVRCVDWGGGGVTLTTDADQMEFDVVIVTVPLGVLKADTIRFEPALPRKHQKAIRKLGLALLNKLYLRFEAPFWNTDKPWIMLGGDTPRPFSSWLNFTAITGAPVLCVFQGADQAWEWEQKSDEEVLQAALDTLAGMYRKDKINAGA